MGLFLPPFDHGVDGIVTREHGVVLSVRGADCPTILACDAADGVVGALHSGWRGTLENAVGALVSKMVSLGAQPHCITAAVGPCIKGCCYEVGRELFEAFDGRGYGYAFVPKGEKFMLDLSVIIKAQLVSAGIPDSGIDVIPDCTCCSHDYFSHRRMGVNRGTGGAMIAV